MSSIIEQERRDAVAAYAAQIAMVHADEVAQAYRNGHRAGHRDGHISEGWWWRFGVLCGIALSALVWAFWP